MISFLDDVRAGKSEWIMTDYILDETGTLLLARGCPQLAEAVLNLPEQSNSLDVEWMNAERFPRTRDIFLGFIENHFSTRSPSTY